MDVSRRREELVGLLRRRSNATADELARELSVSVRTVFRDLDAMRMRGFAIDGTVGRGGGVQLDPTTVLLTTQLTTEEVVALLLSVALHRGGALVALRRPRAGGGGQGGTRAPLCNRARASPDPATCAHR